MTTATRSPARWTRSARSKPGETVWDLIRNGVCEGMVSFIGPAHQRCNAVLGALNELEDPALAARTERRNESVYVAAGWPSAAVYEQRRSTIREFVDAHGPDARADVAGVWERINHPHPMTPDQMTEWESTVYDVIAARQAQEQPA